MRLIRHKGFMAFILLFAAFFLVCPAGAQVNFQQKDKDILEGIFKQLNSQQDRTTAELVVAAGKLLLETPYLAHTLEGEKEQLVINLRELDCTTYAENCLAIARCIKKGTPDFSSFKAELTGIRYRNGKIRGYPSRLHYFSEWIYENDKNKRIKRISEKIANTPYPLDLQFMSTHPDSYRQLKSNPEFVKELAAMEKDLSARKMFYIPKNKLLLYENKLKEGDILGITTSISGLDFVHVGIVVIRDGKIHLMHASSNAEKVIISENTLYEYLQGRKSASGIMVARPL